MHDDHLIIWSYPGLVLQTSTIEGYFIDPDEASLLLDQCSEEALEDLSVPDHIFPIRLSDSKFRL